MPVAMPDNEQYLRQAEDELQMGYVESTCFTAFLIGHLSAQVPKAKWRKSVDGARKLILNRRKSAQQSERPTKVGQC